MSVKSNTKGLLIVGGIALAAWLLWDRLRLGARGAVQGAGTVASGAGSTGTTNPTLAPIGMTAALAAGSTALNANVGATNPFTITGMSWGNS